MNGDRQLTLGFEYEPADAALEELLSRVAEVTPPYDGWHGYHVDALVIDGYEPVGAETEDGQA